MHEIKDLLSFKLLQDLDGDGPAEPEANHAMARVSAASDPIVQPLYAVLCEVPVYRYF